MKGILFITLMCAMCLAGVCQTAETGPLSSKTAARSNANHEVINNTPKDGLGVKTNGAKPNDKEVVVVQTQEPSSSLGAKITPKKDAKINKEDKH